MDSELTLVQSEKLHAEFQEIDDSIKLQEEDELVKMMKIMRDISWVFKAELILEFQSFSFRLFFELWKKKHYKNFTIT
jgi:hypothetical protein